jgi:hypothetical protein
LAANVSSVSWNGISTTAETGLWRKITNTSGSFADVLPTLTLNNGVTLKGKLKTDVAVTGVQKVEWISNTTTSTQNQTIVRETGQQETKSFNMARVVADVITDRKKVYPEKSKPSDTQPFNVAELKATLTQQIPSDMNASLYFYVTDNTNERPGTTTDIVITGGTNNGTTVIEPAATNLNKMTGSLVGRTYVKFNSPAHAGDDYIGVAHPESGLTVTVNSDKNNPKAQVGTTILSDPYQSKLLTVWRTLWIELDRMAAPTPQAAPTTANPTPPNPNGFAHADKGTLWDTTVPSSEPSDFDLLSQPDYPDISLLKTAMEAACVDVNEATDAVITGWGLTSHRETTFVHNLPNNAVINIANFPTFDVKGLSKTFWIVQGLGAYEGESHKDNDPNTEIATRGIQAVSKGYFLIYNETIRDFSNNTANTRSEIDVKKGVTFHECLHCFGVSHAQGGIMDSSSWVSTISNTVWDKLLKTHVITIQSADAPNK